MLNPKLVLRQLIPILRPLLFIDPAEVTTFRLVKAPTDIARSAGPYGTAQIVSDDTIGQMELGDVIDGVGLQFKSHYNMTVRINTFESDAVYRTNILRSQMENPDVKSQLSESGFGFIDVSTSVDLTGLDDTKYEERSRVDITLYVAAGDLSKYTATNAEDIGKAGKGEFFNIVPVEKIDIVSFYGQDLEETITISKDD